MKKILPLIIALSTLITPKVVKAQSFSVIDTVYSTMATSGSVTDIITNHTSSGLVLKWRVDTTNFPIEWLADTAFGICDNYICHYNDAGTPPFYLWNPSTDTGGICVSAAYPADSTGDFHLSLNLTGGRSGTYFVTVGIFDPVPLGTSHTMTFIITKPAGVSVPNVPGSKDVLLYPNPASNELNLVYDAASDIKNIAVYNIIGKAMSVYKVTGNSANLNLENIPSGIYFVRLYNGSGNVVATRKFTKQ